MISNPYMHLSGRIADPRIVRAGFTERQVHVGPVTLNYVVGPDHGPPLVLIPAQMGTWESYRPVMVPLSSRFQLYGVDIRGHGKSSWTPGDYSWRSIGADMSAFLTGTVKRRAIVAGNSSGGIIALWCAANLPERVAAAVIEDAPVFSAELPRFKEHDRFVYNGLKHLVDTIGDPAHRDLADYFRGLEVPVSDTRVKRVPEWLIRALSRKIRRYATRHPGLPVEVGFPSALRMLLKSLSMFDPDFSRAFVDGRFYDGIDHADALRRVKCPMLVLHADWHRYPAHGLVGAMDDKDSERILQLAPQTHYRRISANHVIHAFRPAEYVEAVMEFAQDVTA